MIWPITIRLYFLFTFVLLSCCLVSSAENDWQQISEDTLMLEVKHPKVKRQILYPLLISPLVNLRESKDNEGLAGSACVTPKGQPGVCARLKHCYPIMYTFDLDDNGVYEGNVELAQMFMGIAGSCNSGFYSTPTNGPSDGIATEEGVVEVTQDLVCCTGNLTRLNMPLISRPYIQNGVEATPGQYPAIVAMMHGLFGSAKEFCGGSLVDNRNVLTAAHCIHGLDGVTVSRMTVQIGDHNIYSGSDGKHETRKVSKLFYHKSFSSATLHNDVALLRLATPVEFTSRIKPIALAATTPPVGTSLKVAGWGRLLDNGQFPTTLRHASVPLISNQECKKRYGTNTFGGVADSMLCTFNSNSADACQGDSGGPLIHDGTQVGLVSWGLGCGSYPGVYTRVSSFLPWIQKNMKQP